MAATSFITRSSVQFGGALATCSCRFSSQAPFHASRAALLARLPESELVESFVRGSGPGGQKINKVKNCVQLKHVPTGLTVHCQEARTLSANRSIARKLLERKVEHQLHGKDSKAGRAILKKQRQKQRSRRRARQRLSGGSSDNESGSEEEEEPVRIKSVGPNWSAVGERPTTR